MITQTLTGRMFRYLGGAVLMGAAIIVLASCATPIYPTNAGDQIDNLSKMTANGFDHLEADHRQMKTDLSNISAALDGNNEKTLSLIDDLAKQIKAQQADIAEIKARLSSTPSGAGPAPAPGPGPGPNPTAQFSSFVQALNAGKTAFDQAQYGPAAEALKAALTMAANDAEKLQALYWLGETAFAQRDYPTAERNYMDAIQLNPQSLEAWMGFERLGDMDRLNNNNQNAIDRYNTILSQYPKYPAADRVKAKIAEIKSGSPAPAGPAPNGGAAAPATPPAGAPMGAGALAPAQPPVAPVAGPGIVIQQ